ncbi:MAG: DUF1801 domain-containing protein [Saprospiraceae bacterium]|nr:DUF1801 domain-containing protein [Saprospiraceae bacterium]
MKKKEKLTDAEAVNQWLDARTADERELIDVIRAIVTSVDTSIAERIKWNAPSYHINGIDFLTFGPVKNGVVLLVFHHIAIVRISSTILTGDYKDRRLVTCADMSALLSIQDELRRVVKEVVDKIV